jgi:hypothetical protein
MRISQTLLVITLPALTLYAVGQVSFPNKMSSAEAAKIVGRLPLGMAEREMVGILKTNGLGWVYTEEARPVRVYPQSVSLEDIEQDIANGETNASPKAICSYALLEHCVLRLDVSLEPGASTNRVLQSASIESNGVRIASITLKPRPESGHFTPTPR